MNGRRTAIEQHFKGKALYMIKSPITNEMMGKRILPAIQQQNLIQTLIDNSMIEGLL